MLGSAIGCNIDFVNVDGRTSLINAISLGSEQLMEMLLDRYANVNEIERSSHRTALFYALENYASHPTFFNLTLNPGAQINVLDLTGVSPLCLAAEVGSVYHGTLSSNCS